MRTSGTKTPPVRKGGPWWRHYARNAGGTPILALQFEPSLFQAFMLLATATGPGAACMPALHAERPGPVAALLG